ncbi:hypothetical protein G6F42_027274 [Rhizopus arrhizus]|nr:hypothetical protein G6F42_027274 [Rhizopus arrhizus]
MEIAATRPSVENTLSMNKANRVKFVESALMLDVFGFLNDYLLYFKQNRTEAAEEKNTIGSQDMDVDSASSSTMAVDGLIVDPNDYTKFMPDIALDFQKCVIEELQQPEKDDIQSSDRRNQQLGRCRFCSQPSKVPDIDGQHLQRSPQCGLQILGSCQCPVHLLALDFGIQDNPGSRCYI